MKTKLHPLAALRWLSVRRWVPYALFALGCGLSLAASWYVSSTATATAEARTRSEFLTDAQELRRQIQVGLTTYFEVVRAGSVLLASDNEIQGFEFRAFVNGLQLRERYPGMQGIGFAQRVRRQNIRPFLRMMTLDGVARLRLWPQPQQTRAEYYPTIFLEPADARNRDSIGFDLGSDPTIAEAMQRARDTGQPTATSKLVDPAVWEKGWQGNFVLLIPVYGTRTPLKTVEARRRWLLGFVFSPFNSDEVIDHVVTTTSPTASFEVYDGSLAAPATLLGRSATVPSNGRYQSSESVQVAGREWLVSARSIGEPVSLIPQTARETLIGGLILSFMLLLITRAQVRAFETAARHEAELRASEQALRESESQAQAANRAKDEFLATLSHELRTPLNAVLGWVSMLQLGSVRPERRDHALEIIERNARHQAELIDDLLDVSRIVMGKIRLQLRPITMGPIVSAVADSLRPGAEAKGITLTANVTTQASSIRGDADRLHQIVWNLVSNAIKFTPSGGRVFVDLTRDGDDVVLRVRDTGVGITSDFLPHVFERFRQADSSTTRTHSGVGLGLAIVRHLVELHGGNIDARSAGIGQGAEFVIRFPSTATTTAPAPLAVLPVPPLPSPRLDGIRVLVVDDDPNTRELLTEALGTTGAQVTAADSARQALQVLSSDGADAVVSDIAMPEEDGFWLMRRIRDLPGEIANVPAIALTALARADDRARAIEAGYQMHLAKPVQLGELQAGLATLLGQHAGNHQSV